MFTHESVVRGYSLKVISEYKNGIFEVIGYIEQDLVINYTTHRHPNQLVLGGSTYIAIDRDKSKAQITLYSQVLQTVENLEQFIQFVGLEEAKRLLTQSN